MYNRNEIKQIIFRLDFDQNIAHNIIFDSSFIEAILKKFSITELDKVEKQTYLKNNGSDIIADVKEIITKKYSSLDGKSSIKFNNNAIIFDFKTYVDYSNFNEIINDILNSFFNTNDKIIVSRVGFRFLNAFDHNKYDCDDFNNRYSVFLRDCKNFEDNILVNRSMLKDEFVFDNIKANVNFGYYNPAYPSQLSIKHILLDIDAMHFGSVSKYQDLKDIIDSEHDLIDVLFENYINDNMREKLGRSDA